MAVLVPDRTCKNMKQVPKTGKKHLKKVLVVAQELKLARVLAGNNKTARDRALKSLKKWFQHRASKLPFTEDDFLRLWKGLFYSMWMSDKPLIQEECAENIANLVHELPLETGLMFYKCGMRTLMNEWFGIDQLRLDKFLMFVRRLLRQALFVLKNDNWRRNSIIKFTECISLTILEPQVQKPMGLLMHFIEIYVEELAKVSDGGLPPHLTTELISPFIRELAFSDDPRIIDHIRKHIFIQLIRQSDLGLEYQEKYEAWRSLGFPGSIDSMKKIEVPEDPQNSEEEPQTEKILDPRAGRVDVNLSQIKFHSKAIVKVINDVKFDKNTNSKSRKCLNELTEHFKKLGSGTYPLGVKKVKVVSSEYDTSVRKAVNRLFKFDQKTKPKKRKPKNDLVELRSGKKIKLDVGIADEIQKKLKKKRKMEIALETPPKQPKMENQELETIFRRNSGTWFVTKTVQEEEQTPPPQKDSLFPKNQWEESPSDFTAVVVNSFKSRISLPENLIKNPFVNSTPVKKVKINTKLNRSQDVQEHQAQILSSPAIPYDANKRPAKPLLKPTATKSPINPFY